MDLVAMMLDSVLEAIAMVVNTFIDILMQILVTASDFGTSASIETHISPLMNYTSKVAYTFLATIVLVSILKKLITDDDISFVEALFRITITSIVIVMTPLLIDYAQDKSSTIINEMLALITVTELDANQFNAATFILAVAGATKFAKTFFLLILVTVFISLLAMVVLFLQSLFYGCMLIIAKMVAPMMALGVMNYNFNIFSLFIKDVLGFYITRIIQLVLIKLSFVLVIGAFFDGIETLTTTTDIVEAIPAALITVLMNILTGATLMITLIFLPGFIKKYTTSSGVGGAIKNAAGSMMMLTKGN